jgi:protein dithiol:quinone oxidoreductase
LPKDKVPACGPGLSYMLERFPLFDAFEKIFRGSGECAEVGWRLFGLSIAEWSLVWFVLLGTFAVFVAASARRQ